MGLSVMTFVQKEGLCGDSVLLYHSPMWSLASDTLLGSQDSAYVMTGLSL